MKTLLWLALLSAPARAAQAPTLESAQSAAGAIAQRAAQVRPERFPRGEDPRPDRLAITLGIGPVVGPESGVPGTDQPIRDFEEISRARDLLEALSKRSKLEIVVERDPGFRDRWTARVRAEGWTVEGQAVWTRAGTPPAVELTVTWSWPIPGGQDEDEFSVRTHVHVDPQGRLTPVAHAQDRRDPTERRSLEIQTSYYYCHECMSVHPGGGDRFTLAEASIVRIETR